MDHLQGLNSAQKEAVCATEGPVLVLAGAGAGKTKTIAHRIVHIVNGGVPARSILAITFTNKAAREMRERVVGLLAAHGAPTGTGTPTVSTFHALCAILLREHADLAGLPKHFVIFDRADSLRAMKRALKAAGEDDKRFEPRTVLGTISRAKNDGETLGTYREQAGNAWYEGVVAQVWGHYERIVRAEGAVDFDDLLILTARLLKTQANVREKLQKRYTYLHVDEYQDTNKVQYEIVRLLAGERANVFAVGDGDQCCVAGTVVTMADSTTKPIERVRTGDQVASNYGSGDVRPATVLRTHRRTQKTTLVRVTTRKGRVLETTPTHMHFAGYRLGIGPQIYFTYLMEKRGVGFRVGVSCIYTKGQQKPMVGFQQRCNHEHADFVWIIATHATQQEARVHEYTTSLHYGIPTIPFVARKGRSRGGYVHDQDMIDMIFAQTATAEGAQRLLAAHGLSYDHPSHHAQAYTGIRRVINIALCGDRRGATPMHRISMIGRDAEGAQQLRTLGFSVRPAKQGSASWRFETANKDFGTIMRNVEKIKGAFPEAHIHEVGRLGTSNAGAANALPFTPASSLRAGMAIFTGSGAYDIIENVETLPPKKHMVHDLDIAHTHNYIANDITTHNSIYGWRGANLSNILDFERDFPGATVIRLEQNYRSSGTIVQVSNEIIKKNRKRKEKTLFTENPAGEKIGFLVAYDERHEADQVVERVAGLMERGVPAREIAILYRANFQSRAFEEAFLAAGLPYRVLGTRFFDRKEVKDVLAYVRAALNQESWSDIGRIINVPARGIGKVTFEKLLSGNRSILTGTTKQKVDDFFVILDTIAAYAAEHTTSETLLFTIERTGIEASLSGKSEEDVERLENIKELVSLATVRYDALGEEGIVRLLEDASLATDQDELDHRTDRTRGEAVTLMTVHAAKGLEFAHVFVTGLEDGLFPHERMDEKGTRDDEEERRLFYVALTRAKTQVHLSYAQMRTVFGRREPRMPSEFVLDVDERYLEVEEVPEGGRREKTVYLD